MDTYEGLFGFKTERRKYERANKFRQRFVEEEREYIENLINSQVKIPKGYNQLVWGLKGFTDFPIYGYKTNWTHLKKHQYKGVYKNITVRFELE